MNALVLLVATTALGIEVGWEPLPGGGHEYTIQIEPQLLKVLEQGQDEIYSEVPTGVDVKRYRIVVGVGKLARDYGPLDAETPQPGARPPAEAQRSAPAVATPPAATNSPAPDFGQPQGEQPPPDPVADPFASGAATAQPAATPDQYGTVNEGPLEPVTEPEPAYSPPAGQAPAAGMSPPAGAPDLPGTGSTERSSPAESAAPSDPWGDSAQADAQGRAETLIVDPKSDPAKTATPAPNKLPDGDQGSASLATFAKGEQTPVEGEHEAAKPKIDEVPRPWLPLILTLVLLGCSIGGNIYLAWIARDARARYRSVIAKFRGAPA